MKAASDFFENPYAKFWIHDGLLHFEYKPQTSIDILSAIRVVDDRIALQNERSLPILCDLRGVLSVDKAARDYLARSGSLLAKAVAILACENVTLTVSTFYLEINKPSVPTKIFTSEAEALEYLRGF